MKLIKLSILLLSLSFLFTACVDDEIDYNDLHIDISGLKNLGDGYVYANWLVVDGNPHPAGTFTSDDLGNLSQTEFTVMKEVLDNATSYFLTVEPENDFNPAPSASRLLGGVFNGSTASISVDNALALGVDLSTATGQYILETPTTAATNDSLSGIWFLDPATESPSLVLPTLPEGWIYEGWAVVYGIPLSTGKFMSPEGADDFDGFSGPDMAPPFPGEDFVENQPDNVPFPPNLAGGIAIISVEPYPDFSPMPFILKPLRGDIPTDAVPATLYPMENQSSTTNPMGTVTK